MTNTNIYQNIAMRTGGDIYVGVVGPVRTGKSTFIKRFMETLVIPNIENEYIRERARDELPQSGSGRTIMTAEPKFVPEDSVNITVEENAKLSVRLIDCVGYMVDGAMGQFDGENERMVTTPWFDREIPMREAAEIGTKKVISEHSTIGIVVTTDGTVTEIPREGYESAEKRVITELQEIGKPFIVIVNSQHPEAAPAQEIKKMITETYGAACITANCMLLEKEDISSIIGSVLYEFPLNEFGIYLPAWVDALDVNHPIKAEIYTSIKNAAVELSNVRSAKSVIDSFAELENVAYAGIKNCDFGTGNVYAELDMPRTLFYQTISEQSGLMIKDDGDLVSIITELAQVKSEYKRIESALKDVREKGYGIVMPGKDELLLQEPEVVKQGGRYGVRLKASAPSIHMIMANVETEVSPGVGGEKSSEDIINYLLQEFEGNVGKIWESNIFGKSLYDIAGEGLNAKIKRMPEEAQSKLQETLERIINEGSNGLICIIL